MDRERGDIFAPFAQWRQRNLDRVEAKKQVLPEPPGRDFIVQVGVGRGNNPHIRVQGARGTDSLELARLDDAQQFRLLTERQVGDLVEEKRALIGQLEPAGAVRLRVGEGAFDVTEQLALEHALR